ncbi:methyl-accepting chemotaxis protein [Caldalkalibacillus salinus]|uniref:methyl-accepting chemotaxis protein n=1 Tax=Caldalkalibacillus salinus TaxID=2803787 RepID=UPI001924275F|nr:methyl-accepting chemotaxis protein [Caldalkalibacillus salinus]
MNLNLRGIQGKLILVLAITLIVPTSILGFLSYKQTEVINHTAVIGSKEELEDMSSSFKKLFEETEELLDDLSQRPELNVARNNFQDATTDLNHLPSVNDGSKTEYYYEYFKKITDESEYIMNAYVGSQEGEFYLYPVPPSSVDLTEFDPRVRDWYQQAVDNPGQIIYTEPYIDTGSGDTTLTLAKTVHANDGSVVGVVGLDFEMNKLAIMSRETIKTNTFLIIILSSLIGLVGLYFFIRSFTSRIYALKDTIAALERGDYTQRVNISGNDEISELSQSLNRMADTNQTLLRTVLDSTSNVTHSAHDMLSQTQTYNAQTDDIARAIEEIASGATDQANSAEENSRMISELADMVIELKEDSQEAATLANQTEQVSTQGVNTLTSLTKLSSDVASKNTQTVDTIQQLGAKSKQVGEISQIITNIADQTNLLALNAAIEAARAGEHGKGFAVVADEVRKLAEESGNSASNIEDIVKDIQNEIKKSISSMDSMKDIVDEQNNAVDHTKESFEEVLKAIEETTSRIQRITTFIEQIDKKKDGMLTAIEDMSAISEETAASSEEVSATTEEQRKLIGNLLEVADSLEGTAQELEGKIRRFTL